MIATAIQTLPYSSLLNLRALWPFLLLCPPSVDGLSLSSGTDDLFSAYRPALTTSPWSVQSVFDLFTNAITQRVTRALHRQLGWWDMVQLLAACGIFQAYSVWGKGKRSKSTEAQRGPVGKSRNSNGIEVSRQQLVGGAKSNPSLADPGLLKKHSTFKSYSTSVATYPSVRTFYRPHPQADKLPNKPTPLPLICFVHGLGGSLAQFHPLLTSLVNVAPCLGIDLPGCGLSQFLPKEWKAYSVEAMAELLNVVIGLHCDRINGQGVILIGHSMGCSLSATLASSSSSLHAKLTFDILGFIAICPQATPPSRDQIALFRKLLHIPGPIFDIWRQWDRRGGPHSASVARFVGPDADLETKKLQEKFNEQSRTPVWRRMAWGALPEVRSDGTVAGGLPGPNIWAKVEVPLYLIAGEMDMVTKPDQIAVILEALGRPESETLIEQNDLTQAAALNSQRSVQPISDKSESPNRKNQPEHAQSSSDITLIKNNSGASSDHINGDLSAPTRHQVVKASILPSPASHALLYSHATYRTLAGLIQTFLADQIDYRLSIGWQLHHMCTEGKWDVKNLEKWQAVAPVSEPIVGIFRAMKTLREIDDTHSPTVFVSNWRDKIKAVIDISHESPVYDPKGLEKGGIEYHKFPTVSKIPPTPEEVKDFIILIDRLRFPEDHSPIVTATTISPSSRPKSSSKKAFASQGPPTAIEPASSPSTAQAQEPRLIGVHCHYGFNRTGFFIASYLIERENYGVQQAIDLFAEKRAPGIRHEHFVDTLFGRYCFGGRIVTT